MRAERILDRGAVPPAAMVAGIRAEPIDLPQAYERVIGLASELQAVCFLPRGVRAAATVARIGLRRNGRELPLGTGFLVSRHGCRFETASDVGHRSAHVIKVGDFGCRCAPSSRGHRRKARYRVTKRRRADPKRPTRADTALSCPSVRRSPSCGAPAEMVGWT